MARHSRSARSELLDTVHPLAYGGASGALIVFALVSALLGADVVAAILTVVAVVAAGMFLMVVRRKAVEPEIEQPKIARGQVHRPQ